MGLCSNPGLAASWLCAIWGKSPHLVKPRLPPGRGECNHSHLRLLWLAHAERSDISSIFSLEKSCIKMHITEFTTVTVLRYAVMALATFTLLYSCHPSLALEHFHHPPLKFRMCKQPLPSAIPSAICWSPDAAFYPWIYQFFVICSLTSLTFVGAGISSSL